MPRVLVPLADGFEETEAVTLIDMMRRGGIEVVTASLNGQPPTGSHNITIQTDLDLDRALNSDYDMVVLPGGQPGADNLEADARIRELLLTMAESGRFVGAICAAPKVLKAAGILDGKTATSFPGILDRSPAKNMTYSNEAVVQDGNILTSRGPGTAMDFALKLVELLRGESVRDKVEAGLQRPNI